MCDRGSTSAAPIPIATPCVSPFPLILIPSFRAFAMTRSGVAR